MARRRKRDDDWIGLIAQWAGAVILLSLISPLMRQTISTLGFMAVCLLAMAIVGLIGFSVYRWVTRFNSPASSDNAFLSSPAYATPPPVSLPRMAVPAQNKGARPQTTADILEQLRSLDWFQFEKLVGLAYRKLGYTVTRRGGANPDGGIDLVIEKDAQESAVQCKHWKTWSVGVKAVREFLGALTDAKIQQGIFITLCGYTGEAKQLAEKHGIELVNETGLARMLESTSARFDSEVLAILRDRCKFCPKCESEMVRRRAIKGPGAGKQFWGCSTYPRCRFTMPVT